MFSRELQQNYKINYLQGQFPGKLISKEGDISLPPRSPDIALPNFILKGQFLTNCYDFGISL